MKPFLKWAGGKYRLVGRITAVLPPGECLVEPFVGSGAVFLNTDYPHYLLADVNADLIALYRTLQREGEEFIDDCEPLFAPENNCKEAYYAFRAEFNRTTDARGKAALFLYLNKHGFNGLCRYNASGQFNVPFGRYHKPYFPRQEMLAFHRQAQRAEFVCADFTAVLPTLSPGDVVYCDPPYVPLSDTANFTSYSAGNFDLAQQRVLAQQAETLAARGIPVIISNHHTPFTEEVYGRAALHTFQVQRHISCDGANRQKADELLAVYA